MNQTFNDIDFGILDTLLKQEDVTDVSCKNGNEVWVTSNINGHYCSSIKIHENEITRIANQIANKMQKEFNPSHPNLEGDIQNEDVDYRVGCVHQFLSPLGTTIVIRKVRKKCFLTYEQLIQDNSITKEALDLLILATKGKANLLFIGETGSGKTELLKFLMTYISVHEVVVTIEDSMEFNMHEVSPQNSVTSFRVRSSFSYSDIIAMSLRLNVQRILLQEARGIEVNDLIDAMSTGHTVMTTMHARSADHVVSRIMQMIKNPNEEYTSLKKRIYALFDLIIRLDKFQTEEGILRKVTSITEFIYDPIQDKCESNEIYYCSKIKNHLSQTLSKQLLRNAEIKL